MIIDYLILALTSVVTFFINLLPTIVLPVDDIETAATLFKTIFSITDILFPLVVLKSLVLAYISIETFHLGVRIFRTISSFFPYKIGVA